MLNNVSSNNTYINPFMNEKFAGSVSLHTQLLSFIAHLFNIDIAGVLTNEKNTEAGSRIFDDMLKSLTQTGRNKYRDAQYNMEIVYDEVFKKVYMNINGEEFNFNNITGRKWKNLTDYIHKTHPLDKNNYNIESNRLYSADIETEFMGNINENITNLIKHTDIDKTIISAMLSNMHKRIKPDNHWKYSSNINIGDNKYTIMFNHSEDGLSITYGEKNVLINVLIGNDDRRTGYIMSHLEDKCPTKMDTSGYDKHPSYAIELFSESLKDTISLFYNSPKHEFNLDNIRKGELTLNGYQQWFYFIDTNKEDEYPIVIEYKWSPDCLPWDNAHELRIMGNGPRIICLTPEQIIKFDGKLNKAISNYLNEITDNKNLIEFGKQTTYTYPARIKQGLLRNIQKAKAREKTPHQEETKQSEQNDWSSPDVAEKKAPLKSVRSYELEAYLHEYNELCDKANSDNHQKSRDIINSYLKRYIKDYSINDMASMGIQLRDLLQIYPLTRDNLISFRETLKKDNVNIQMFNDCLPGDQHNRLIDDDYRQRLAMLIWAGFNSSQLNECGFYQSRDLYKDKTTLKYLKNTGVTIDDFISCYGYNIYSSASLTHAGFSVKDQIQHAKNTRNSHLMNNILKGHMTMRYEVRYSGVSAREIKEICDAGNQDVDLSKYFPDYVP